VKKHIAQTRRFFQIPFYLLMPGLILLALIGGSYVGRECEIICDRAEGSCRITSAGYLFSIEEDSIPINSIISVVQTRSETSHQSGPVGSSSRSTILTTQYNLFFKLDPKIADHPWLEIHTYDLLSNKEATVKAAAAVSTFLENPQQVTVAAQFGSHRSGYAMSLLIFIVGLGALCFRYGWQLTNTIERLWTRKNSETRLKFSIEVPFLGMTHTSFDLVVNGNRAPVADEKWVKKLPIRTPAKLRAQILRIVQEEHVIFDEHVKGGM
jgi:hypothetical protein